jgi:hypothetical protein
MYFPKGTILALYFQVFPRTMPVLRTTLYFVTGCTVLCCCATFGLDTFYCHNITDNWYVNMTLKTDLCFMCRSALCSSLTYARHQHIHRLLQLSSVNIISTASQWSVINMIGVWLIIIYPYRSLEEGVCSTFESLRVFQADWAMEFTTDIFSELSLRPYTIIRQLLYSYWDSTFQFSLSLSRSFDIYNLDEHNSTVFS